MTHRIRPGVYEEMITAALQAEIDGRREDGWRVDVRPADVTLRPEFLARHVFVLLRRALEAIHGDEDAQATLQVALANRLVEALFEHGAMADDRVAEAARLLIEAADRRGLGDLPSPLPRPTLSFRRTGLLVNGRRDVQIASEIAREIPSADRIDLLCAFESRLWDALDQGLLCPFHYFGVNDTTDLSTVRFERGRYVAGHLDNVLTGDHARALRVRHAVEEYVTDPHRMRALGFCAGVAHAHFMAAQFTRFGYEAVALDGGTPQDERRAALVRLRRGELRAIFAVDLFNEGVDLPEVDTVLMLRPTESATVFLQQLGRGLRWAEGKRVLTVIDLVGQVQREYRYDVRYRALLGGTRHQVQRAIEADFPHLPPGCALKLDRIAKETVLRNLREAVRSARARLADDLRTLGSAVRVGDFMREAGAEFEDIYARPQSGHCFVELRRRAGFSDGAGALAPRDSLLRAVGRLLHVDDHERLAAWRAILESEGSDPISSLRGREHRLGLMLFAILSGRGQSTSQADVILQRIRESGDIRQEIDDLLDILGDRIRTVAQPLHETSDVPLASHATYGLAEIAAAHRHIDKHGALVMPQTGVLWHEATQTDLLFVTLEKSDADFSPTTRYADYPISPTLFHWESQNSASADTPTGCRYVEQPARGTNVILFVRERKRDGRGVALPYCCLGRAHYRSHESERPMKVLWELERPMPGWLYQAGKVVAG